MGISNSTTSNFPENENIEMSSNREEEGLPPNFYSTRVNANYKLNLLGSTTISLYGFIIWLFILVTAMRHDISDLNKKIDELTKQLSNTP
ncbi:hypothetical protein KGF54_001250 [Candida jiufengensis]|uniref:uncharacterized protein n=1 Tax=Candida jiufengensis TaxID=497108 RepID=UPI0022252965|nr:uncharacterized protein KGF54_001250 [Candida jiufengensis]KAI5955748.1 hypothetical protein KGF54_001250 [Candida jiufengensis]